MPPSRRIKHLRTRFSVESGQLREQPDGGIVIDASVLDLGDASVAVCLIADLAGVTGGRNTGASATNAIGTIICTYRDWFIDALDVSDVIWIQLDSMGGFDTVVCHVAECVTSIDWKPLISGQFGGRTEADFLSVYGYAAERAMANVRAAVATTPA